MKTAKRETKPLEKIYDYLVGDDNDGDMEWEGREMIDLKKSRREGGGTANIPTTPYTAPIRAVVLTNHWHSQAASGKAGVSGVMQAKRFEVFTAQTEE